MTTKIPVELSSTPGIVDGSNATAITIDSSENSTFAGNVKSPRYILDGTDSATTRYIFTDNTNTGDGRLIIQSGGGSAGYGGAVNLYSHAHASKPGDVVAGISSGSSGAFRVNTTGIDSGSDVIRVDSDGLKFGSDTAAANALDDYEEGTFDANLEDSGGGATLTLNSSYNALAYTKIGRQVLITGVLVVSGVSGTANGTLQINNLPFASAALVDQAGKSGGCGVSIYQVQKYSSGAFPVTSLAENSTVLQIQLGVVDANTYACYANTATQLYFSFSYITA